MRVYNKQSWFIWFRLSATVGSPLVCNFRNRKSWKIRDLLENTGTQNKRPHCSYFPVQWTPQFQTPVSSTRYVLNLRVELTDFRGWKGVVFVWDWRVELTSVWICVDNRLNLSKKHGFKKWSRNQLSINIDYKAVWTQWSNPTAWEVSKFWKLNGWHSLCWESTVIPLTVVIYIILM